MRSTGAHSFERRLKQNSSKVIQTCFKALTQTHQGLKSKKSYKKSHWWVKWAELEESPHGLMKTTVNVYTSVSPVLISASTNFEG